MKETGDVILVSYSFAAESTQEDTHNVKAKEFKSPKFLQFWFG